MKILRLLTLRNLLFASLVVSLLAAFALPPEVAARKATRKSGKHVSKPAAITGKYVSVTKDGVNVRSYPSTSAEVRWELFKRYPLLVKKRKGAWLQVADFEGDSGWIHESLVSDKKSVIAVRKRINLRQDPNSDPNNPIIAVIRYGVVFTPLEKSGDWLRVRHADNTEGWLNKDLVWPPDPLD